MKVALGDRMKAYEERETHARFLPNVPIIARVDGRCFSSLTKGMDAPFDSNFSDVMRFTAKQLVAATNANIGYVQSDEINLCWYTPDINSEIFFGGRKFKMIAQLAALATAYFHVEGTYAWGAEFVTGKMPTFDARVFQVPTVAEGANAFLWRQQDARRNAISMVANSLLSHNELMGRSVKDRLDVIESKGINYSSYPWQCRHGVFVRKTLVERDLTEDELVKIPEDRQPTGPVKRHEYQELDLPLLSNLDNPADVIFFGAEPLPVLTM
jgi:tRNA(His) 5'-end guanylyltransferase